MRIDHGVGTNVFWGQPPVVLQRVSMADFVVVPPAIEEKVFQ